MDSRVCPKCGAEETDRDDGENGRVWFACGTSVHPTIADDIDQTYECQDAQVEIMQNQIDVLTARAEKAEAEAHRAQCFIAEVCADIGRGCKDCNEKRCPNYPVEVEP